MVGAAGRHPSGGRAGLDRHVGKSARAVGGSRALLVTDRGLERAGHADQLQASLETAGFEVRRLADVRENPSAADIEWGAETARDFAALDEPLQPGAALPKPTPIFPRFVEEEAG